MTSHPSAFVRTVPGIFWWLDFAGAHCLPVTIRSNKNFWMLRHALHSRVASPTSASRSPAALRPHRVYRQAELSTGISRISSPTLVAPQTRPSAAILPSILIGSHNHNFFGLSLGRDVNLTSSKRLRIPIPQMRVSMRAYATSASTPDLEAKEPNWAARQRHFSSPSLSASSQQFTHHVNVLDLASSPTTSPPTPSPIDPSSAPPRWRLGALLLHYCIMLPCRGVLWVGAVTAIGTVAWFLLSMYLLALLAVFCWICGSLWPDSPPKPKPKPAPAVAAVAAPATSVIVDVNVSANPVARAAITVAAVARGIGFF